MYSIQTSIDIRASKPKVWDALTNPEQIKKYFFGTKTTSDWKKGSPIRFSGTWEGKPYEDKGTILEIEKEKILKYNYWSSFSPNPDLPENYADITYALSEANGHTVFTITQNKIKTEEARDHSKKNWESVMQAVKEMLEKEN